MRITLFFLLLIITNLLFAQDRNFRLVKKPTENPTTQQRKAVVIGMSEYGQGRGLNNTLNDANDMSVALAELGFEVTLLKNNDLRNLKTNLNNWYSTIQGNDMAIFYFAGHGVEVNGENFLIPIDADINSETDVTFNTLNVNSVLGNMDEKKVGMKLIILDACRDNPFKRSWSRSGSGSGGLAQISAPRGTYIAFAASPGFTAQDGGNFQLRNGVFTHYLKNEIRKKGISIDEIFNNVSGSVSELTGYKQTPFKNSSLTKTFYFIPPSPNSPNIPQPQEPAKKYYYYIDQAGYESTTQFSTREEAINALKSNKKYGKVYSNMGEIFIVDAPINNDPKPADPKRDNPRPNNSNIAISKRLKQVETNSLLNKIEDCKTELDQISLSLNASDMNAEIWYWISRINAAVYKNETLRTKYPNAVNDADFAFQKFAQLDPNFNFVKQKGADGYFDMYATSFSVGINSYKEKNYDAASNEFEKAVIYSDYIFKNKWASTQQPFDTTSILYCAYSFDNAQKPDDAVKYYSRLAENKVRGEGFADIYMYLVDYYSKKKNKERFEKYMALGKEVYPKENWKAYEIEYFDRNLDLIGKTALYDQMEVSGNLTETDYLQFGDLFVSVRNENGVDKETIEKYNRKAIDAFKKAYGKNNNNAIAAFNVGVTYYNFFILEDDKYAANIKKLQEINTNKPVIKDPSQKATADAEHKAKVDAIKNTNAAIEKTSMEYVDLAAEWLTKSYMTLKDKTPRSNTEKIVINKSVDFIANIYYYKMGRVRGKDAKLFDAYEAKYKEFDALHATFK